MIKLLVHKLQEVKQNGGFDSILQDEQIFWRQRSRIAWLKEGDRNKKFFYIRASARKRKNAIKDLVDKKGVWTEDDE